MPPKKPVKEDEFLSTIACPRFIHLNYNPYQFDRSQSIALNALKYFYQNIDNLYKGLDVDNLINSSVIRAIGSKLKNELDAYKKSIKLYSYTFIYDFIKKFPLELWSPVLVDLKVPFDRQVILKFASNASVLRILYVAVLSTSGKRIVASSSPVGIIVSPIRMFFAMKSCLLLVNINSLKELKAGLALFILISFFVLYK